MGNLKIKATLVVLAFLCIIFLQFSSSPLAQYTSLEKALSLNLIEAKFRSAGGHKGNCIIGNFKNKTSQPIKLLVESGRRLVSTDTTKQDILITRELPVILAGNNTEEVLLYGFCCQSHNSSPTGGDGYTAGKLVEKDVLKLAHHLNDNKYPVEAEQHAVWVFSNGHSVNSVHHENRDSIVNLLKFMAKMKKVATPKHSFTYAQSEDELFTGIPIAVHGNFMYKTDNNEKVHLVLYDVFGRPLMRKWTTFSASAPEQQISFNVKELEEGKYFVKAYNKALDVVDEISFNI